MLIEVTIYHVNGENVLSSQSEKASEALEFLRDNDHEGSDVEISVHFEGDVELASNILIELSNREN